MYKLLPIVFSYPFFFSVLAHFTSDWNCVSHTVAVQGPHAVAQYWPSVFRMSVNVNMYGIFSRPERCGFGCDNKNAGQIQQV